MLARYIIRFRDRQGVERDVTSTGNTLAAAVWAAQKWAEHNIVGPAQVVGWAPVG